MLKSTPAGARAVRPALPAALAVGAHTYTVTLLSRHEVGGAPASVPAAALPGSAAVGPTAAALPWLRGRTGAGPAGRAGAAIAAAGYATAHGRAQDAARRDPSAENVRQAVGAGILGLIPLQAAPPSSTRPPTTPGRASRTPARTWLPPWRTSPSRAVPCAA